MLQANSSDRCLCEEPLKLHLRQRVHPYVQLTIDYKDLVYRVYETYQRDMFLYQSAAI